MNKRQAKKQENKMILLQGISYKEHKQEDKAYIRYATEIYHRYKVPFKGFDETEQVLIEMGVFTPEEIISRYGRKITNNRWRQRRKYNKDVIA